MTAKSFPRQELILLFLTIFTVFVLVELILPFDQEYYTRMDLECYPSDPRDYFPGNESPFCVEHNYSYYRVGPFPQRVKNYTLVGDSFTFGQGVRDHDNLAYLLGSKYEEYNFINKGKSGAGLDDIKKKVLDENHTKGYIYFYNLNDVQELRPSFFDFQNIRFAGKVLPFTKLYNLVRFVYLKEQHTHENIDAYNQIYQKERNLRHLHDSFSYMKNRTDLHGQKLIVVIYPLLYKNIFGNYPFEESHEIILETCADLNITCIDGIKAFTEVDDMAELIVHPLDYHPNEKANRMLVEYLFRIDFIEEHD